MKSTRLVLFLMSIALPIQVIGCGSAAPNKSGGTGGEEDTGGKTGTGGKAGGTGGKTGTGGASGGSGGDSGGSGGASTGGSGGASTGGSGGSSTGGSGGSSTGGSGGASTGGSGGGTGGAGGTSAPACGMGRTKPASAIIDNFGGQSQVIEWLQADDMNVAGTKLMATNGALKVTANGKNNYALGALAPWAAMNRPCIDASMYTGIQFKATGDVTALIFRVVTPATLPPADGGICVDVASCYGHRQLNVTAGLTGGAVIKVPFADLVAPFGTPPPVDKSALVSIIFKTTDANVAHSFTIDDISYY